MTQASNITFLLFGILLLATVVYGFATPYLRVNSKMLKKYFNLFRSEKIELHKLTKYEQLDENNIRIFENPEYWIDVNLKEIKESQRAEFINWLENEITQRAIK